MDETEVKTLFTEHWQVGCVNLLTEKETGKSKGLGFIEVPVYDHAKKAVAALNGKEFYGTAIALSEAPEMQEEKNERFSVAAARVQGFAE